MVINIGDKIKKRAKELRIGPTELGQLINTSKQNIYGIYKRQSIDTEILRKLSIALEFDFFSLYQINSPTKNTNVDLKKYVSKEEFDKLLVEFENIKEKYNLLKNLNELLLEKNKTFKKKK